MKTEKNLWARQCDITGEGMNEGYCIDEGFMYIKHKKDMIAHLREIAREEKHLYKSTPNEIPDDFLIEKYYQEDYFYWTEWECKEDFQYQEINGKLIEIN